MTNELNSLRSQFEESEATVSDFSANRLQLIASVEEARQIGEEERRAKSQLASQLRLLNDELNEVRYQLKEEIVEKEELQKSVARFSLECQSWKAKYEAESLVRYVGIVLTLLINHYDKNK